MHPGLMQFLQPAGNSDRHRSLHAFYVSENTVSYHHPIYHQQKNI